MESSTIINITTVISILIALTAASYGFINHYQQAESDLQKTFIIKFALGLTFYLALSFVLVLWLQSSMAIVAIVMTVPAFTFTAKAKYNLINRTNTL
ncbi:MAG: hypothetical protein ACPGR2_05070 [Psychrobium sp.]